jgi:hypothetical protein
MVSITAVQHGIHLRSFSVFRHHELDIDKGGIAWESKSRMSVHHTIPQ